MLKAIYHSAIKITAFKKLATKLKKNSVDVLLERELVNTMLLAKMHVERVKHMDHIDSLADVEFKVFSQKEDDGIIQYLINKIEIKNKVFIEFGVENYVESNTRFLLLNDNWTGVVIDGTQENIDYIKNDKIYWSNTFTAICQFVTTKNINQLFLKAKIQGDIGLLSIDIDGNDYWIWEAINVVNPRIVICEFNSVFGDKEAITIPYDETFHRTNAHYSELYFGASLKALCDLAEKKGYDFIGCNSKGVNAYFVRKDISGPFKKLTASEGYVESVHRESRDETRKHNTYISGKDRLKVIQDCEVYNLSTKQLVKISSLFKLR